VECLREALSGQSQFSAGNSGTGGEQHESARSRDAKDRRFLRLLHRRSGNREERLDPSSRNWRPIARVHSGANWRACGTLQMVTGATVILFRSGRPDPDDSEAVIPSLIKAAGPADRTTTRKRMRNRRDARTVRAARTEDIRMLGDNAETAKKNAETLMRMETALQSFDDTGGAARPVQLKTK